MIRSSCNPVRLCPLVAASIILFLLAPATLTAQAVTIDSSGRIKDGSTAPVDRRYAQIEPTHVALGNSILDTKTRLELIRVLEAEQGFAMRPFPRGHKGLVLVANGKVEPAGDGWLNMVTENGLSAKPGDRVVLTDVKIEKNKMVFDLNGGPDQKHRILRHIEVGGGLGGPSTPVVQDNGEQPTGARLTLAFEKDIPALTGSDVKALLSPLISFDVKTPVQAYTDTLPPVLKDAILNHHVLVGMDTEMVLFALGPPEKKIRETDGDMPFEEWIYGQPPKPVQFVRFNSNHVIRLEIAKVGETPTIFTKDEVTGLMRTDGTPITPTSTRTISLADGGYNPDTQAAPAPPSLKKPGEKLPDNTAPGTRGGQDGEMGPVQFPKPNPANDPPVAHQPQPATQPSQPAQSNSTSPQQPAPQQTTPSQPAPSSPPAQPAQPAPQPN
jgi:hypothetical protein